MSIVLNRYDWLYTRDERIFICKSEEETTGDIERTRAVCIARVLPRSRDTLHLRTLPIIVDPKCTAFEIGSARYSSTRDPGYGIARGGVRGEVGPGEAHRLSYNLCSHLKETLPGGTGSRIARTPRVWSYITFPAVSRIVRYRFDWSRVQGTFQLGRRLTLKKCCHLKVKFPPWFRRRRKGYPDW